jgi:hypothetical protein
MTELEHRQSPEASRPQTFDSIRKAFRERGPLDRTTLLELLEMAEGGNPTGGDPRPEFKGIRDEYYPGWSDDDFKALLKDLGYNTKT